MLKHKFQSSVGPYFQVVAGSDGLQI